MRLVLTDRSLQIQLAWWEKLLGLVRDIEIPREDIADVTVVEKPMWEVMAVRMKFGLRLPFLYYVARTIRLDQAFFVRRGRPGVSLTVLNHEPLRKVLISAADAEGLAARLSASAGPAEGVVGAGFEPA